MIHSAPFWEHVRRSGWFGGLSGLLELFWEIISACILPALSRLGAAQPVPGAAELHLRRTARPCPLPLPTQREHIHTHTCWLTHTHFRTRLCQSSPVSWVLSCSTRRSSHSAEGINRATLAKLNSTFVPGETRSPRAHRRISHFEWQRRSRGKITRLHKMDKGTGLLRPVILFITLGKFWLRKDCSHYFKATKRFAS